MGFGDSLFKELGHELPESRLTKRGLQVNFSIKFLIIIFLILNYSAYLNEQFFRKSIQNEITDLHKGHERDSIRIDNNSSAILDIRLRATGMK